MSLASRLAEMKTTDPYPLGYAAGLGGIPGDAPPPPEWFGWNEADRDDYADGWNSGAVDRMTCPECLGRNGLDMMGNGERWTCLTCSSSEGSTSAGGAVA